MKARNLLIVSFVLTLMLNNVFSQSYYYLKNKGTDTNNYKYNTLGIKLLEGTPAGLGNVLSTWQSIPFDWYFYGQKVAGYYASDNGYITFDQSATTSYGFNYSLPDVNAPKNAIFGFWDGLELLKSSAEGDYLVHSWTMGAPPNRIHIIHWFNIHVEGHTGSDDASLFFAIRLHESGDINFDIVYDFELLRQSGSSAPTSATIGLQNSDGTQGLMAYGSPSKSFPKDLGQGFADDVVYEFYYGDQNTYDIKLSEFILDSIASVNTDVSLRGRLVNYGSEAINSFNLNYSVNNGSPVTSTISPVNIPSGETYNFTHPVKWKSSSEGQYIIKIWASNINGNIDEDPSNNELQDTITIVGGFTQRTPLHEVFVSSTCVPCVDANTNLEQIFNSNLDKYTLIKYPMNIPVPGDPYYTNQAGDRKNYYNIGTSVPSICIDGSQKTDPKLYSQISFDHYYDIPSVLQLSSTYMITGKTVDISVDILPLTNLTSSNLVAHIAIIENITSNNIVPGYSNGETEFYSIMKRLIPTSSGTLLGPLTNGASKTLNESYTFPDNNTVEEFSNLSVVIFVQNNDTKEVLQSCNSTKLTSIENVKGLSKKIKIYPCPASNNINFDVTLEKPAVVTTNIFTSLSQKALLTRSTSLLSGNQIITIDISNIPVGIYIVETIIGDQKYYNSLIKN